MDKEYAGRKAVDYFSNICGFHREKEKYKAMLDEGLTVRDQLLENINIKVVISEYDNNVLYNNYIKIDDVSFKCNAFEQIDKENIIKVYPYILTVGDVGLEHAPMLDKVYADAWGTAYVDASRDILKRMIVDRNHTEYICISDSFGPGYYGMDITQVINFFKILEAELIQVKLTESGLMLPIKTCAGFFLAVNDEKQLPKVDCKLCLSNEKGCQFCRIKMKK